jgi:hypothetical protein
MSEKRRIVDILAEADAAVDAMGLNAFLDAIHRDDKTPALIELKEALALGQFAQLYNETNTPKLTYARANPARSGGADFTVWDEIESWSRDLELTSLWEREDDFPRTTDEEDPNATHVWLEMPRLPLPELRREVTKKIKRVLYQHARRRKYPTYWLAIYVNLSLEAYQLPPDYVAKIATDALSTKPPSSNVERVWVWNPRLCSAFPA